ncbi:MAG TPA: YibE/F family protein, partial [Acidimicrobiia bacterium]
LSNRDLSGVLTGELVASEVVRTLVGSLGLVAAVPLTTALAAFVAERSP